MQDLKTYQNFLNLNSRRTLRADDFDTEEAYEAWRRAEGPELSQMMLAIVKSNPQLAKSAPGGTLPQFSSNGPAQSDANYTGLHDATDNSSYVFDQPVDMSALSLGEGAPDASDDAEPFVFVPPEPKAYYRAVLKQTLTHDLREQRNQVEDDGNEQHEIKLLTKYSTTLLNEICMRWRIPLFTRQVLFLDVIKEKFLDQDIGLELLDAAFTFAKRPLTDPKKSATPAMDALFPPLYDRSKWTVAEYALNTQILSALHDALLRDLYDQLMHCYESRPPNIGPLMCVLDDHIYADPLFSRGSEEVAKFAKQLAAGLREQARRTYESLLSKEIPTSDDEWQFYHIIQLGRAVVKLAERIQKRYRKSPEIMGVNPLVVLLDILLPSFGTDARDLVQRIMQAAQLRNEEVAIQDGFELYQELVEIRRIHADALPEYVKPINMVLALTWC